MATAVNMPKLGLSMKEGTVGKWLKSEGDKVKKGEALLEVMTDKISNKIDAPADGTLLKIIAKLPWIENAEQQLPYLHRRECAAPLEF